MGNKAIRTGQLIAPFGPGSLYTDSRGTPHVVCGLDLWYKKVGSFGISDCDKREEFECPEPRLSALLKVERFCAPPDFRSVRYGQSPPPNASLHIPAQRFPRWYRHTKTSKLRRFNLHSQTVKADDPKEGGRWQPVRFISVCAGGHLGEFPWKQWIGCHCAGEGEMILMDRGGTELESITVECKACSAKRSLAGMASRPGPDEQSAFGRAKITCQGDRPWLGEGAAEPNCGYPLVGALLNQTNLYFPRTISAILLPGVSSQNEEAARLQLEIRADTSNLGIARTIWNMGNHAGAAALASEFSQATAAPPVEAALPAEPEGELLAFRREEFNFIRHRVDDPQNLPDLRVIPAPVPAELARWLAKVNLVERLRETRVFYGFDRLEENTNPLADMPESAMRQLFRRPPVHDHERWLPAIEVFGEGIYLELSETRLLQWQADRAAWLKGRLDDHFVGRMAGVSKTLPPAPATREWASRYLLVHSLAHILINQFVFECGYSTAALRERLYISADDAAPMAGILIYTAAGDSEGTLGGLVRLGRPERLWPLFQRALSRAAWCSADPVCSEHLGGQGSRLANLAACHACVLLPETSCETINQGLDRAMVVGTPETREHGFMAMLIEGA